MYSSSILMLMVYKYKDVLKDLAIGFTVTFSFEDLLLVCVANPLRLTIKITILTCRWIKLLRDRRQKTFGFLNRLCLLISNPLPPLSLTDSLDFLIQHRYLILIHSNYLYIYCLYTYTILI